MTTLPVNIDTPSDIANHTIDELNQFRFQVQRSKNIVNYSLTSQRLKTKLSYANTPMNVLSFTLYYAHFFIQLKALITYLSKVSDVKKLDHEKLETLSYQLINDLMWGTTNLISYVYLSFDRSRQLGLYGLQLEVFAQGIDILITVIKFYKTHHKNKAALDLPPSLKKSLLLNEHTFFIYNAIRTVTTLLLISLCLSLLAFSVHISFSISPLIFSISLLSNSIKLLILTKKNNTEFRFFKQNQLSLSELNNKTLDHEAQHQKAQEALVKNYLLIPLFLSLLLNIMTMPLFLMTIVALPLIVEKVNSYSKAIKNSIPSSPLFN